MPSQEDLNYVFDNAAAGISEFSFYIEEDTKKLKRIMQELGWIPPKEE